MKILLSYPSEYDQGEGIHYSNVLRRLGHEVVELNVAANGSGQSSPGRVVRGYPATVNVSQLLEEHPGAALFLYVEPTGLIPRGLEHSPIPTACVLCDCHRNLKARQRLAALFDFVFIYQRNYVSAFRDHPKGAVQWLPYACDTSFFKDLGLNRDLDVAFIGKRMGRGSERDRLVAAVSSKYRMNEQRQYLQSEIAEVYSRANMVLNVPLADDLNFRFFEALSCGALLVTKRMDNGQEELFAENRHYVAFADEKELLERVEFYLSHPKQRTEIAEAGHAEVLQHHTLELRIKALVEKVVRDPVRYAPVRSWAPSAVLGLYAEIYERAGQVEALLRLAAEQRKDGIARSRMLGLGLKSFVRRALFS